MIVFNQKPGEKLSGIKLKKENGMKVKLIEVIDEQALTPEEAAIKKEDLKDLLTALKANNDQGKTMSFEEIKKQDRVAFTLAIAYGMVVDVFGEFRITEEGKIALAELVEADKKEE
ncbi:MAG: hypothetical protein M1334_00325 [Patescibacteria group bacterium]|nr:hypothetical protein [Patescibacteria group bacterium]